MRRRPRRNIAGLALDGMRQVGFGAAGGELSLRAGWFALTALILLPLSRRLRRGADADLCDVAALPPSWRRCSASRRSRSWVMPVCTILLPSLKWYLYVVLLVAIVVLLQLPGQSDAMLRELHEIKCCSVGLVSELPSSPAANRYHASMIAEIRIV